MVNDLLMPKLGLTMTEGVLAEWQIAPGDMVKAGQTLFVVETDKLATDIEAVSDGQIIELLAQPGETLAVGAVLGRWTGLGRSLDEAETGMSAPAADNKANRAKSDDSPSDRRIVATPLARRVARQQGMDLGKIAGSGPHGRIKAKDLEPIRPTPSGKVGEPDVSSITTMRRNATPLQLTIARRLSASKRDIPHFYLASEANMGPLLDLRSQLNADVGYKKLSLNHFILAAVAHAWANCPDANRVWVDDGFVSLPTVDVGFAVDTPRGLFAPVLRSAATMDLDALGAAADATAARAREGRLTGDELTGGAVSVSNVGMYGVTYLTPIINPGQSAIVGVGTVRSVFRPDPNNQPVAKRELGLVLACDHRAFNGVAAAQMLDAIVMLLENPLRLLRGSARRGLASEI